jgi:hypothetical protein
MQNPLEQLLESKVGSSPIEKSLRLIHILDLAECFGMCRATVELEVRHGRLKPVHLRGRTYFSKQDIVTWFATYQKRMRSYPVVRARSRKARAAISEVSSEAQLQA